MAPALMALTASLRIHVSRDKQHHALGVMRQNLLQPFIPLFATDGIPMEVHIEHDDIGHERIHHSDDSLSVLITLIPSTYGFKSILSDKRTSSLSSTISIFPFSPLPSF